MNCITSYSVSYSFYFQSQLACWAVEYCCVKGERCFNESWQSVFWVDFSTSVLTDFWLIFTDILIDILISLWAAMNDIWLRLGQSPNKQSQLRLSCTLLEQFDWSRLWSWDDLTEWKSLSVQCYAHEVQLWILEWSASRNTSIFFERRIVVTEC